MCDPGRFPDPRSEHREISGAGTNVFYEERNIYNTVKLSPPPPLPGVFVVEPPKQQINLPQIASNLTVSPTKSLNTTYVPSEKICTLSEFNAHPINPSHSQLHSSSLNVFDFPLEDQKEYSELQPLIQNSSGLMLPVEDNVYHTLQPVSHNVYDIPSSSETKIYQQLQPMQRSDNSVRLQKTQEPLTYQYLETAQTTGSLPQKPIQQVGRPNAVSSYDLPQYTSSKLYQQLSQPLTKPVAMKYHPGTNQFYNAGLQSKHPYGNFKHSQCVQQSLGSSNSLSNHYNLTTSNNSKHQLNFESENKSPDKGFQSNKPKIYLELRNPSVRHHTQPNQVNHQIPVNNVQYSKSVFGNTPRITSFHQPSPNNKNENNPIQQRLPGPYEFNLSQNRSETHKLPKILCPEEYNASLQLSDHGNFHIDGHVVSSLPSTSTNACLKSVSSSFSTSPGKSTNSLLSLPKSPVCYGDSIVTSRSEQNTLSSNCNKINSIPSFNEVLPPKSSSSYISQGQSNNSSKSTVPSFNEVLPPTSSSSYVSQGQSNNSSKSTVPSFNEVLPPKSSSSYVSLGQSNNSSKSTVPSFNEVLPPKSSSSYISQGQSNNSSKSTVPSFNEVLPPKSSSSYVSQGQSNNSSKSTVSSLSDSKLQELLMTTRPKGKRSSYIKRQQQEIIMKTTKAENESNNFKEQSSTSKCPDFENSPNIEITLEKKGKSSINNSNLSNDEQNHAYNNNQNIDVQNHGKYYSEHLKNVVDKSCDSIKTTNCSHSQNNINLSCGNTFQRNEKNMTHKFNSANNISSSKPSYSLSDENITSQRVGFILQNEKTVKGDWCKTNSSNSNQISIEKSSCSSANSGSDAESYGAKIVGMENQNDNKNSYTNKINETTNISPNDVQNCNYKIRFQSSIKNDVESSKENLNLLVNEKLNREQMSETGMRSEKNIHQVQKCNNNSQQTTVTDKDHKAGNKQESVVEVSDIEVINDLKENFVLKNKLNSSSGPTLTCSEKDVLPTQRNREPNSYNNGNRQITTSSTLKLKSVLPSNLEPKILISKINLAKKYKYLNTPTELSKSPNENSVDSVFKRREKSKSKKDVQGCLSSNILTNNVQVNLGKRRVQKVDYKLLNGGDDEEEDVTIVKKRKYNKSINRTINHYKVKEMQNRESLITNAAASNTKTDATQNKDLQLWENKETGIRKKRKYTKRAVSLKRNEEMKLGPQDQDSPEKRKKIMKEEGRRKSIENSSSLRQETAIINEEFIDPLENDLISDEEGEVVFLGFDMPADEEETILGFEMASNKEDFDSINSELEDAEVNSVTVDCDPSSLIEPPPTPCPQCNKTFYSEQELASHMQWHTAIQSPHSNSFVCSICFRSFSSQDKLQKHKKWNHEGGKRFYCPVCRKRFTTKAYAKRHVEKIHKDGKLKPKFSCKKCPDSFPTEDALKSHEYKIHTKRLHQCEKCLKSFGKFGNYQRHVSSHTVENGQCFPCAYCSKVFNSMEQLHSHWSIHKKNLFKCESCDKEFTAANSLKRHKLSHAKKKLFRCEICQRPFSGLIALQTHLLIHTGVRRYECKLCHKTFNRQDVLNAHQRVHTGEKTYQCNVCNKRFRWRHSLKSHVLIHHSTEKPHACKICGKRFSHPESFKRHSYVHSEKLYRCQICLKTFSRSNCLKIHIITHTNHKPFLCSVCSKGFRHKDHLKKHSIVHSVEKPWLCKICSKTFKDHDRLRRHKRRVHSKGFYNKLSNRTQRNSTSQKEEVSEKDYNLVDKLQLPEENYNSTKFDEEKNNHLDDNKIVQSPEHFNQNH